MDTSRSVHLLRDLLNESEKKGVGSLVSLNGLVPGEMLSFVINNEQSKFDIKMTSNHTVMDLRLEIAKKASLPWETVKLIRMNLFNQNRDL